jgi:3-hydroxyisobutyrate dehydrogenase-like beta-hydroxyacid dehydrogenase
METVGFVGTGAMGTALLSRLQLVPISPTAFDVVPAALEQAMALGAEPAPSAKAVAQRSTLIDVVVRTDQEVLECTLGAATQHDSSYYHEANRPGCSG